jgi:hypothetical protein
VGAAFWTLVLLGFFYVLFSAFDQHHGGLEAVRREIYATPNWQQLYQEEYLKKIQSNRIFGTMVYPNALAGAILLLLPISLWKTWELTPRWPRIARGVILGLFAYLGLGCLYWSGSKGGWLIALGLTAVGLLHLNFSRKIKIALVAGGLALGLAAFFIRYSAYFERGATSVGARFTYWSAAVQTFKENPILGTGPGTFAAAYRKIKPPDAEMAKLTHNDYLEQAWSRRATLASSARSPSLDSSSDPWPCFTAGVHPVDGAFCSCGLGFSAGRHKPSSNSAFISQRYPGQSSCFSAGSGDWTTRCLQNSKAANFNNKAV